MTTPVQHRPRGRRRGRRHQDGHGRRRTMVVALPLALLASSAVVYQASNAAFTASTDNGSNTWSSGTVTISDDDSSSVMYNATNIKPGSVGIKCINVTYSGSLAGAVRLYATASGTLGQYLDVTIEEGSGAAGGATLSCTGFTSASTLTSGGETLDSFATAHTDWTNGVSSWAPTGASSETKSYRVTVALQDTNSAQNKSASATFTWEARNT